MHLLEAIEGPPATAEIQDSVGVSGKQLEEYARRYSNLMAATRPARDSLRATMESMRTAYDRGDRAAARDRWQRDGPAPEARDGWTYRPNGR